MTKDAPQGFNTRSLHVGAGPDPSTGSRQVPIHQTSSFVFKSSEHAATLFALKDVGYIYSRLTNPTVGALEERLASLEGAVGATCASSGHAAQMMALLPLVKSGERIVAGSQLYGGTVNQFARTFPQRFGWGTDFVDATDAGAVGAALKGEKVRALFVETLDNPGGAACDVPMLAGLAHEAGVPLIVDNTSASPALCRPLELGADIVVNSTTKFLTGNGSVIGGMVADSGKFDWGAHGYDALSSSNESYGGAVFTEAFGPLAYMIYQHAVGLRDLGCTMSPMGAFLTLLGTETLSLRVERHCENAMAVARHLRDHAEVEKVGYVGLEDHPNHALAGKMLDGGYGSIFTVAVKGGLERARAFVDGLELHSLVANIGDARSLVIHPASTTHSQLTPQQLAAAGIGESEVRLSVGIEDVADIIADLDQALAASRGAS